MQKTTRRIILIIFTVTVCLLIMSSLWIVDEEDVEYARQVISKGKQRQIFEALQLYFDKFESVPAELDTLVEQKFLGDESMYNPKSRYNLEPSKYLYYPENYNLPDSILISETITVTKKLEKNKIEIYILETTGTGLVKRRLFFDDDK